MKIEAVKSSNIRSVGYDVKAKVLQVEFSNGQVYQYFQVPPGTHAALMDHESKGKFFQENIRNRFQGQKI